MNNNLLILGAGQYGRVAKEIAESTGSFAKISFLDDSFSLNHENSEILGKTEEYGKFLSSYPYATVAIGKSETRLYYIKKLKNAGFNVVVLVSPKAYVSSSVRLENGVIVEPMAVVNSNSTVGSGTYVCAGSVVNHNCFVGKGCTLYCGSVVPANSMVSNKTVLNYNEMFNGKFFESNERTVPNGEN